MLRTETSVQNSASSKQNAVYPTNYELLILSYILDYHSGDYEELCCHEDEFMFIRKVTKFQRLFYWFFVYLTFKRRSADCFILRRSPYRAGNTFHLGYKNQSVYAVSGTSRCLFSDKYKTHKYNMGRTFNCENI
jgi:hypothetical protein